MRYDVTIPNWTEGVPLTVTVEADSMDEAKEKVVEWVNRRAGYAYCTELPPGTMIGVSVRR